MSIKILFMADNSKVLAFSHSKNYIVQNIVITETLVSVLLIDPISKPWLPCCGSNQMDLIERK